MNSDTEDYGDEDAFASPPCLLHEFEATDEFGDIAAWRRSERKHHLAARLALDVTLRRDYAAGISKHLESMISGTPASIVSLYWPIRGEPDLRVLVDRIVNSGGRCALPVVTKRNQPLAFRTWASGERLERGYWNIPVPIDGINVVPGIVIAPLVAFDRAGYRLGYGGGYFDRTLATMSKPQLVIGVGYSIGAIDTIYPQAHDIPMDTIVTELGIQTF